MAAHAVRLARADSSRTKSVDHLRDADEGRPHAFDPGCLRRRERRRAGEIPVRTAGQPSPLRCRREGRRRAVRRCVDPSRRPHSLHRRTPDRAGGPLSSRSRPRRSRAPGSRCGTLRRSGNRRGTYRRRSRAPHPEQLAGIRPAGAHPLGRWWRRVVERTVVDPSSAARRPGARHRRPGVGVDESSFTVDAEAFQAAAETVEVLWPRRPDQAYPAAQPPLDVPPGGYLTRVLPSVAEVGLDPLGAGRRPHANRSLRRAPRGVASAPKFVGRRPRSPNLGADALRSSLTTPTAIVTAESRRPSSGQWTV